MKVIIITISLFTALLSMNFQCGKEEIDIPSCIQLRIDSIKAQPVSNPRGEVTEYEYNGQRVYGINSTCCDQYYNVLDEQCNYICAPSGGLTGAGDGKCPDFFQNAKKIRTVFKDDR